MSEGDTGMPPINGELLELWPGEWVRGSAIATVKTLFVVPAPSIRLAPDAFEGPGARVDFTGEIEHFGQPTPPLPPTMPLPVPDLETMCEIRLLGEPMGRRCAYSIAIVLKALASISEASR